MNSDNKAAAPPSLPKGGGAIAGIGETFQPNLFTGTGNFSIPIATSPGRNGFGPTLSLQYSSGNGNGPFGMGWQLSIPRITRKTEKGLPKYDDSDVFIMSGAEDLVPVLEKDAQGNWLRGADGKYRVHEESRTIDGIAYRVRRYRPRTEGLFARIEKWDVINIAGRDVHWRATTKDNVTSIYGRSSNARLTHPDDATKIFEWLLEETCDDKGNHILYEYARDDAGLFIDEIYEQNRIYNQLYIRRIYYGNISPAASIAYSNDAPVGAQPQGAAPRRYVFEVVFDYGDLKNDYQPAAEKQELFGKNPPRVRDDPFSSYRSGFEIRTLRRCERVLMFHHFKELGGPTLVKSTDFHYDPNLDTSISFLTSVTLTSYVRSGIGYTSASMPPISFTYSTFKPHEQRYQSLQARGDDLPPLALNRPDFTLVDLFGDGLPDVLHTSASGFRYWKNLGGGCLDRPQLLKAVPAGITLSQPGVSFGDMDGDGRLELLVHDGPLQGFFEATPDGAWENFREYISAPGFDLSDPNVRMVDLTGDGRSDALMTRDHHLLWFECRGEDGFGEPQFVERIRDLDRFPDLYFNDRSGGRVQLADMTGDGLQDIVLLHNGRIDYWPNKGYGKFGGRITMSDLHDAPMLDYSFDPKRLFLVDLDGSGCADLVYVEFDRVHFWFNRCGNGWSERQTIYGTPHISDVDSLQFADIFGSGTTTLVWSFDYGAVNGGNYKALDFCGGVKPYVLVEMSNNMGATTRVRYVASTKYAREDAANGTPWVTQLPFPVHVLQKVETIDHIGRTKLVKTYSYHHGFFDGREREFRGFGRVDEYDTEESEAFSQADLHPPEDDFDNRQKQHHVPPVLTKSWFHTGAYFEDRVLTERFRREYFAGDLHHLDPVENKVDTSNTPPAAYRALRGSMMRSEVYALDDSDKQTSPCIVTENAYQVQELQPGNGSEPAVYLMLPVEALTYHYERNPADPRISHTLTLEVDDFGNIQKSAAIGYGRRRPNPELALQADRDKQTQTLVIYTENDYTKPIWENDAYRLPLPCATRTYELTRYPPTSGEGRFQPADFVQPDPINTNRLAHIFDVEIQYEEQALIGKQRRLIEHVRTLYRSNDLDKLLSLGTMESRALPGESYKQALTPGLARQIFVGSGKVTAAELDGILADEGRYVHSDVDLNWWIPSGRMFFDLSADIAHPANTAAQEFAEAGKHFFLPRKFTDPFSHNATVEYDKYDLMVSKTQDAVGNTVTAQHDYRVLQPKLISDPNGNFSAAAFDILGLVAGTAVMGKPLQAPVEGDSLKDFEPDLSQTQVDGFYDAADPHLPAPDLLMGATTRIIYDLHRFRRTRQAHLNDPTKWLPVCAATLARETHLRDLPLPPQKLKIQISFSYSDGFGREIQKKIQAEPGPAPKRDATGKIIIGPDGQPEMTTTDVSPRWVGSGWTIFNNKGKPVRQYEPFFSDLHIFEFDVRIGVSPILFYDPVERVVVTLHPNHAWGKVVFDPWQQTTWDVNDTTGLDPDSDEDVRGFFIHPDGTTLLPKEDYLPTWHALRTDPAFASLASQRWPDTNIRAAEKNAAVKAEAHAKTPGTLHFDCLGRPFLATAHNGFKSDGTVIHFSTRTLLDIEGNQREVRDERINALENPEQRIVMRYDYDMLGARIHQASMEAGERWMLNDVTGKPIRAWNSRGHTFRMEYDEIRRPIRSYVLGADAADPSRKILFERVVYGENHPDARSLNLRGKVFMQFDGAGLITNSGRNPTSSKEEACDFKGNILHTARQLASEYKQGADWSTIERLLNVQPPALLNLTTIANALVPVLEEETFTSHTTYDALNRLLTVTSWDGSVYRPVFNEADLLDRVDVNLRGAATATPFVININYDAKGQRTLIEYGCGAQPPARGVITTYEYDKDTFRLINLKTTRPAGLNGLASQLFTNPTLVQDLYYTYDPTGNIIRIADASLQTMHNGEIVEPVCTYAYDAVYRLIDATGREHKGQAAFDFDPPDHNRRDYPFLGLRPGPNDPRAMRNYTEHYEYDEVGNFQLMRHTALSGSWTRNYEYIENSLVETGKKSNRLTKTTVSNGLNHVETYSYADAQGQDAQGCMTGINSMHMTWDFRDQLQQVDLGGGGTAYYVYDAAGQRVRKVIHNQHDKKQKERIYLGGFEIYREYNTATGAKELERESLHIMDDKQRIALVETKTIGVSVPAVTLPETLTRYQLGNHLGSACLELDGGGQIISYEEYTPYGSTSYQAVRNQTETSKRYRYSGKERDETGLYYYGARYYAAWLGRWTSCDPLGIEPGTNLYLFIQSNPLKYVDPNGLAELGTSGTNDLDKRVNVEPIWSQQPDGPQLEGDRVQLRSPEKLWMGYSTALNDKGKPNCFLASMYPIDLYNQGHKDANGKPLQLLAPEVQKHPPSRLQTSMAFKNFDLLDLELAWNPKKSAGAVAYIANAIDRGRPVLIGVDYLNASDKKGSNQQITDHFLVVYGYEVKVFGTERKITALLAVDNAAEANNGKHKFVRFDVDPSGSIVKPGKDEPKNYNASEMQYQLTQVRVYRDDVSEAQKNPAWTTEPEKRQDK